MNLVSNMLVPEMAKEDILHRDTEGTKRFEEFVSERVVGTTASKYVWEVGNQSKNEDIQHICKQKTKCKVDNKLVKVREDRQLLARFLVVRQSCPSVIESPSETVWKYEVFCRIKGSLIFKWLSSHSNRLDRVASFMPLFKGYHPHPLHHEPESDFTCQVSSTTHIWGKVCIIDAMAVVPAFKMGPSMLTCLDQWFCSKHPQDHFRIRWRPCHIRQVHWQFPQGADTWQTISKNRSS